jgi:SAM-dependent methyltransferase
MGFDSGEEVRLRVLLDDLGYAPDFHWAWENYTPVVKGLSQRLGLRRLCEIGGGRKPLLSLAEVRALGVSYTVNDISAEELARVPAGFDTACFDVAGDLGNERATGSFDLVFSRMVFEHVRDVGTAWSNLYRLLAPGGVAFAFFPTLYSPPFLVNWLVPEWLSGAVVDRLYPHRDRAGLSPKFAAHYDHCVSRDATVLRLLERAGFAECAVVPFWGHDYFRRLPVIREVDAMLSGWARRRDVRSLTSYAYVMARK